MAENNISIMCLNETRLSSEIPDEEIHIEGYDIYRRDRDRQGGGVAMYLKQNSGFCCKLRDDLMHNELESIVIELTHRKSKPFVIMAWYRPPDTNISVFDSVNSVLEKVECENKDVLLIGDVNCDLLTNNPSCYTKKMNEVSESFQMKQVIKEATRITETSETLIDHIYTNFPEKISHSGVIHTGLSDHCYVYTIMGKEINTDPNDHKYSINRSYKYFDEVSFKSDMRKVNWFEIVHCNNIDDAVNSFEMKFLEIANRHAPLRKKRVRHKISPWITDKIAKAMRERDDVKKRASKSKCPQMWNDYRSLRNKVNSMVKTSKKEYLHNEMKTNNSSKVWKGLRCVVPGKTKSCNITSIVTQEGEITNPKEIANGINDYFANVGPNLANKIPDVCDTSNIPQRYNDKRGEHSGVFNFNFVDEQYVLKHLKSLANNKAIGVDNISAKLLKASAEEIVVPLTYLVNFSLMTGTFPQNWKIARICPVFKGGIRNEPCNYRPISILPLLSKIVERAVFDQLYPYLNEFNMIHETQSGFRPGYSTTTALLNVTEDWLNEIDKGS